MVLFTTSQALIFLITIISSSDGIFPRKCLYDYIWGGGDNAPSTVTDIELYGFASKREVCEPVLICKGTSPTTTPGTKDEMTTSGTPPSTRDERTPATNKWTARRKAVPLFPDDDTSHWEQVTLPTVKPGDPKPFGDGAPLNVFPNLASWTRYWSDWMTFSGSFTKILSVLVIFSSVIGLIVIYNLLILRKDVASLRADLSETNEQQEDVAAVIPNQDMHDERDPNLASAMILFQLDKMKLKLMETEPAEVVDKYLSDDLLKTIARGVVQQGLNQDFRKFTPESLLRIAKNYHDVCSIRQDDMVNSPQQDVNVRLTVFVEGAAASVKSSVKNNDTGLAIPF